LPQDERFNNYLEPRFYGYVCMSIIPSYPYLTYCPLNLIANITKICQNGDVILAVGPKAKIQVTSDFLKHISPVFKTMLEGPMSEGEALRNKSPDSPTTISLPADNALAMKRLLRILYGADDLALDFEAVYDIIVLADKYAMAKRLKAFGLDWVRMNLDDECTSAAQFRESWEKMVLSYMLHNDVAFFEVSCYLSQATEGVVTWALELPDQALGLRLAGTYELSPENDSVLIDRQWLFMSFMNIISSQKLEWDCAWTASKTRRTASLACKAGARL
jgi:hypothetical protein